MSEAMKDGPVRIKQVAEYLDLPLSSVYKYVREGKLPGRKIGKHWRFYLSEVDAFIVQDLLNFVKK